MCPMVHARKTKILTHPGRTVERERSTRGHWETAFFRQTHLCTKRGDATRRDRVCIRPRVQRGRARIEAYPLRRSPRGNWRISVTHGRLVLPARFDQNGTFADFCLCQRCAGWPLCRPESQTQWWERRKESGRRRRTYILSQNRERLRDGRFSAAFLATWSDRKLHGLGECVNDDRDVWIECMGWDCQILFLLHVFESCEISWIVIRRMLRKMGLLMFDEVSENEVLFKILGVRELFGRKYFERIIKLLFMKVYIMFKYMVSFRCFVAVINVIT